MQVDKEKFRTDSVEKNTANMLRFIVKRIREETQEK